MTDATEIDSVRDLRDNARGITAMPAFKQWREQMEAQQRLRIAEILKEVDREGVLKQEYMKGEVQGLMSAVAHWDLMVETLDAELQRRLETQNQENDDVPKT